ncbi:MAG: hypothetical protein OXH07_07540 [Chloroflexi bacterium]|nr:hypothetical protein [Chloroflexota bacterium]
MDGPTDAVPCVDLHRHAEAYARLDIALAKREERTPRDWLSWARDVATAPAGLRRLERLGAARGLASLSSFDSRRGDEIYAQPDGFIETVEQNLRSAAYAGATYVEVRFGGGTLLEHPDLVALFREAESRVQGQQADFYAEPLVVAHWPDHPNAEGVFEACLRAAVDGLAGVDFLPVPYEQELDWSAAHRWSGRLAQAGLGITCHAGEFSDVHLEPALRLPGLSRLGHAVHAIHHADLMERIAEAGVTVECCLTSNLLLGAVEGLDVHPLRDFLAAGVAVAMGSDNPVRMSTEIDREYELAKSLGCDRPALLNLSRNGITAAFTTPARKSQLLALVDERESHDAGSSTRSARPARQ